MKRTDITALFPEATEDQIKQIMDLNGADINKARADSEQLRASLSAAQSELEALKAKPADDTAQKLQAALDELSSLKQANSLRDIREKVSRDTGVPASLLTGDTEEACKSQADAIKAYAQPSGYPKVPDGGEVGKPTGGSAARDKFAEWMEESFGAPPAN